MKRIVAKDRRDLEQLIKKAIEKGGNRCDLNHIGISEIKDLSELFWGSSFNGDISKWDVSKVEYMRGMIENSQFNGNISRWDVSRVENMRGKFCESKFAT